MKRTAIILSSIALSLLLVSCGKSENKAPAPQAVQPMQEVQPAAHPEAAPAEETAAPAEQNAAPATEEAPK